MNQLPLAHETGIEDVCGLPGRGEWGLGLSSEDVLLARFVSVKGLVYNPV